MAFDPHIGGGSYILFDGTTICLTGGTAGICNPLASLTVTTLTPTTIAGNANFTGAPTFSSTSPALSLTPGGLGCGTSNQPCTATFSETTGGMLTIAVSAPTNASRFVINCPNDGTVDVCTGNSGRIFEVQRGGTDQLSVTAQSNVIVGAGDLTDSGGNIFATNTTAGKGEVLTGNAAKAANGSNVGDVVVGGGTSSATNGAGCSGTNGCGGHVIQSAYFTTALSGSVTSGSCTAPIMCRVTSTSSAAITTFTLTFIQNYTYPPGPCWYSDETHSSSTATVTYTGTPGTSISAAVFAISGQTAGDSFDVGCGFGNGP